MKKHPPSPRAWTSVALAWPACAAMAAGPAAAQTIRPPEQGDQLVPTVDLDAVIRALARYEVVFLMGILVVAAIVFLMLYERYYSRYLPRSRFRPPAPARVGAPVVAIYGLACGLTGLFAMSGSPLAAEQAAIIPASCLVAGGLALTGLGMLVPFGNRVAGILVVALLAADFGINVSWAAGNLASFRQLPVRVWCGAGVGLLAIWSVAAVFQRWGRIKARERDVHRLAGPR